MSDCDCGGHGAALKPLEEALELMLGQARALRDVERVATLDALDRVLAESQASPIDVPGWDNSAMDGYALNSADLKVLDNRLTVTQRIPAGSAGQPLAFGEAARIFTGAPLPSGADAVVMQEVCERDGDALIVTQPPAPGANIRRAGEDIEKGGELLSAGERLAPQHLGLAASVGIAELPVIRRPKVAIFSSGDELVMPGGKLAPGQIFNSNHFTLSGLLCRLGCRIIDLGQVEDTLDATRDALARAAGQADLVLASGGVSVGEEDHVKPAVESLGTLDLWKIAIRPGKPVAFGHIGDTPFIGAPGNPVSLFVTFCLFMRPFILKMQGVAGDVVPPTLMAQAGFDWPKPDKRREFVRARLETSVDGATRVLVYPSRSSAVLSSVAWANGLAVIGEGQVIKTGDNVDFLPFSELLR